MAVVSALPQAGVDILGSGAEKIREGHLVGCSSQSIYYSFSCPSITKSSGCTRWLS